MKHKKSIPLHANLLHTYQLSADPPPKDSLFWELWRNHKSIAEQAFNTKYVQGMKDGTLDPNVYARYNISDAYYCYRGPEDYASAVERTEDPILKAYLKTKQESYAKYDASLPELWRVKNAESIIPSQVCKEYADYESAVATGTLPLLKGLTDPIYTLIVMLPCEYLWSWLAEQMPPIKEGNLYNFRITGNNDPSGAYKMGNFLNDYDKKHSVDRDIANEIYKQAMEFEYLNFKTAE